MNTRHNGDEFDNICSASERQVHNSVEELE